MTTLGTTASATLTAQIVNPIIHATAETFEMMLDSKVKRTDLTIQSMNTPLYDVSALIGLSGDAGGSICLSFKDDTAFKVVKQVLDMDVDEIDGLVCDAVGEFANIIAGSAKDKIKELKLNLGIPNVIQGKDHHISFPSNSQPLCASFESDLGPFKIAFGFVKK